MNWDEIVRSLLWMRWALKAKLAFVDNEAMPFFSVKFVVFLVFWVFQVEEDSKFPI
jgi:hypothetical protein